MEKPGFFEPIEEQVKKVIDTTKDINILWDRIYAEHTKNADDLIENGYKTHLAFHKFLREIMSECDEIITFFENVSDEFEIAKANQRFDKTSLRNLKESSTEMLQALNTKKVRGGEIENNIIDSKLRLKDGKIKMQADIDNRVGGNLLILAGITKLIDFFQKKKLVNLIKLMEQLVVKMTSLEIKSDKFQDHISKMGRDLQEYIKRCEKCSPDDPDYVGQRVVIMSTNMIDSTKILKEKFEKIKDDASINEAILREVIIMHNPRSFLTN